MHVRLIHPTTPMKEVDKSNEFLKKNEINLKSYSSSPGYAGFFGFKDKFEQKNIETAINYFYQFWQENNFTKILVASSLFIDGSKPSLIDDFTYKEHQISQYINPLVESHLVKINEDNSLNQFSLFEINSEDYSILKKLFYVIMALGGLYGHLFIKFEHLKIVMYPHDDGGFGIFTENSVNNHVYDFFNLVDKNKFQVVIKAKL
jgi:hypothetical protein